MKKMGLLLLMVLPPTLAFGLNSWVVTSAPNTLPVGLEEGRLRPCPPGVDCVSSLDTGDTATAALPIEGDPDRAFEALVRYLRLESGAEQVEVDGDHVHAVFVRHWLKLVESVELHLDREAGVIHLRAFERTDSPASGIRARVDELREGWAFVLGRGRESEGRSG